MSIAKQHIADGSMQDMIALIDSRIQTLVPDFITEMDPALPGGVDVSLLRLGKGAGSAAVWRVDNQSGGDVYEWDTSISGNTITAAGGPIKYSGALIGTVTNYTCSASAIPEGDTWHLFVECDLGAGTVELKVQAARPVDDPNNAIIRVALSTWIGATTSAILDRILHRGAIQLSGIWNQ